MGFKHARSRGWGMALLWACAVSTALAAPAAPDAAMGVEHYTEAEVFQEPKAPPKPITSVVNEAALPGPWQRAALPYVMEAHQADGPGAVAAPAKEVVTTWFRIRLDALAQARGSSNLYLPRWHTPGQLAVYADGQLLYRSIGSPVWNLFSHPALLLRLRQASDGVQPHTLLIRMDSVPTRSAALSSVYVGNADALRGDASLRDWLTYQLPFMMNAAFVAVGLFSFSVWVVRQRYPNLLLFLVSVLHIVRRWHFQLGAETLPIPDAWFVWLTLNALLWQVIATHFFLEFLHERKLRWFGRGLLVLGVLVSLLTLPVPWLSLPDLLGLRAQVQVIVMCTAFAIGCAGTWGAWKGKSKDAAILIIAYWISALGGYVDWFNITYHWSVEGYYFTPYTGSVYAGAFIALMFRRYLFVLGEIETVNAGLEQRLKTREAELEESHTRLREVERQQTLSNERRRLTQDMHDGLGFSLVSALRVVESGRMNEAELSAVLKSCIDDLKLTIDSMEPVEADLLLLLATLRFRLGPRLSVAGVALHWRVADVPKLDWLDPRNSLQVLRILQEAFANVLKHTRATEIQVSTSAADGWVSVRIEDNGQGFDVTASAAQGGKGLSNQRQRAKIIGGEVAIESSARGTRLTLRLPEVRATP